jgi:hypothetical protein
MDLYLNAEFRILRDVDSDNNRRYATANLVAGKDLLIHLIIY